MLLARTDPDVPKHRGLTYFICDMRATGVEVRPLRQMTGNAEFNEVFFTDARIADSMRLGDVGGGWGVALTTLSNERFMLSEGLSAEPALANAIELWQSRTDKDSPEAIVLRDRLVDLHVRIRANRLTMRRGDALRDAGDAGPQGSIAKLNTVRLNQAATELCVDLLGDEGMLFGSYSLADAGLSDYTFDTPMRAYLRARANSIEGGTSEILHNILGERVLGLPAEPRVDKHISWREATTR
jgi:alkylation response protein AidB-like acyl-CoA dehydrogenase